MKRKVGDKIRVREDLKNGNYYGGCVFRDTMSISAGKEYVIADIIKGSRYRLSESGWYWTDEMLEDIESEQEINYMMVWDDEEKEAEKLEVIADLTDNPRRVGEYFVHCIMDDGGVDVFKHCKSIEQWKKDTGFLFENSLHERFFKGSAVYWVMKCDNTIATFSIDSIGSSDFSESQLWTEIMTKESAEKYVKEHEIKYRPFTMEEFDKVDIRLIHKEFKRRDTVAYYGSEVITMYGDDRKLSYADLLEMYTLIDGSPCGMKI